MKGSSVLWLAWACAGLVAASAGTAEVTYRPKLHDGKAVATDCADAFLRAPATMSGVAVAETPPTVDFLYYFSQTCKAKTWSNWGDGAAVEGKYYSTIGDHNGPVGNAFVYEYDAKVKQLRVLCDVASVLKMPKGHYVLGAHAGGERDGTAVVQFDVRSRTKKVIAFLHPFLSEKYGHTPIGTFGTAVHPAGDKLYVTWNGGFTQDRRGRPNWDACALTVIHIPASERQP